MKLLNFLFVFVLLSCSVLGDDLYNTSALDDSNNIYEYAVNLNTITEDGIGLAILMIVSVIAFTVAGGSYQGIAAASFFSGLIATILLPLGMIPFAYYELVLVLDGVGMIMVFLFGRG